MNRPYIVCHMVTSLDGKVTGAFLSEPACEAAVETYYEINRQLKCGGFICGRVTMEESFTKGWYPDLTAYSTVPPDPDTVWQDVDGPDGFYAIAFDTKGRLGWTSNRIEDEDPGYDGARIIEVLTEQADPRYLNYLRQMKIPYVIAGKEGIDVALALELLSEKLGVERLLLEGGSCINGAFQRVGAVDELSLVVAPMTAQGQDKPLFMDGVLSPYVLSDSRVYENGTVWLNYKKGE